MGTRKEVFIVGALCIAWYTLSSASNVVGKLVLTELPFPITVTTVQLASTVMYSVPAFAVCGIRRAPSFPRSYYLRVLVPLAIAKFLTTMFSQISIWKVPISYAHTASDLAKCLDQPPSSMQIEMMMEFLPTFGSVILNGISCMWSLCLLLWHQPENQPLPDCSAIASRKCKHFPFIDMKATTPLWTAALAWVLFGERQSRGVQGALVLIAAGVAVASATELHFDAQGLGAALAAAALLSLQHLYSKRVMRESGAHHLRLLQLLSALALVPLVPVWLVVEVGKLAAAQPTAGWSHAGALLAVDGALAWLQAVAAFSVLSRVSPLAYAVASAAKRAAVVAASLLVLRNPAPPLNLAGMALAALGVLAYNRAKLRTRPEKQTRPLLPI